MRPILFEKNETAFAGLGLGVLPDAISCIVTEERNGAFELELVYPVTGVLFADLVEDRIIFARPRENGAPQAFRIYRITQSLAGQAVVNARHISYEMSFLPVAAPSASGTAQAVMQALGAAAAEPCRFIFESDMTNTGVVNIGYPVSLRAALGGVQGSVLDTFGGEFTWDNWTVKLLQARGQDNGVRIRYGKNLTALERSTDIGELITGVLAFWQGEDANGNALTVYSSPAIISNGHAEDYAHPRTAVLDVSGEFSEPPTAAQVTAYATNYLAATSLASVSEFVTVDFVPLWHTQEYKNALREHIDLCDTVTVEYERLGVNVKKKVTKTVYDVLLDRYQSIELGTEATVTDTIAQNVQAETDLGRRLALIASDLSTLASLKGLKIETGDVRTGTNGTATVPFNNSFQSPPVVFCEAVGSSLARVFDTRPGGVSATGFTVYCTSTTGGSVTMGADIRVFWIAVGE